MARKPETKFFKNAVEPLLKSLPNTWFYKTQEVSRRGILDIVACVRGQFVSLELKIPPNTLDGLQEYNLMRIRRSGGLALEITPENWTAAFNLLREMALGERVLVQQPEDESRIVQLDH